MSKSAARGAKNVIVKLIVGAGQASPSPPVGPALGSKGVKSMDFCKEFNALTAHITPGTPVPAIVTVRPDRSFTFSLRTPPTASLLLRTAGVKPSKGQKFRGANAVGRAPAELVNSESSTGLPADVRGSMAATTNQAATANPGATAADASGAEQGAAPTSTSEIGQGVVRMVAKAAGGDKQPGHGGGSTQVGEISLKHVYEIAKIKQTEARLSGLSLEGLCKSVVAQARSIGVGIVP